MARPKPKLIAFKAEEELAELLDRLPNKSEFIRRAVLSQIGMTCPLCLGVGNVSRGVGTHFTPVIADHMTYPCAACGEEEPIPRTPAAIADVDRPRWEQFFHGGPFYCGACFERFGECADCGWHVDEEHMTDHACDAAV